MNALVLAGSIVAILTYFPLWKQIRSGKARQNLLTWALWGALDAIVAATIIVQHGSWLLPVAYTFGSGLTVVIIMRQGDKASWTWFETMVASLALVSMVVWYLTTNVIATVASTSAMLIAGMPQLKDAWQKPEEMPLGAYASYFVANLLCTAGGADWSIKERFYPASAALFCLIITMLAARRLWQRPASEASAI